MLVIDDPDLRVYCGDALATLRELPAQSVHCCVTSPPYFGQRDYGTGRWEGGDSGCDHRALGERRQIPHGDGRINDSYRDERHVLAGVGATFRDVCGKCGARRVDNQLGLERTPQEFAQRLAEVFRELRRVLRDDGTLWLVIGDGYAADHAQQRFSLPEGQANWGIQAGTIGSRARDTIGTPPGLKGKDLMGIPWRVAFALQEPYVVPTCVATETGRAWLAALFDGEGTIGVRRFDSYRAEKQQVYQDGFVAYTVVANTDMSLLDRCVELTGYGRAVLKQAARTDERGITGRRDCYGWRLDGNKAIDVVRAIYPYLVSKRKQACIAYTLDCLNKHGHGSRAVPLEIQEKKRLLWELVKRCNQREHVDLPNWIEEPRQEYDDGWYLRSEIIWHKPNGMPESARDRPTRAHEQVFLFSKRPRYFYDGFAVSEPAEWARWGDQTTAKYNGTATASGWMQPRSKAELRSGRVGRYWERATFGEGDGTSPRKLLAEPSMSRNLRSVWTIATEPLPIAHFAAFPQKLVETCVLAGTSERGCCPDCGAPWVRKVTSGPDPSRPQARRALEIAEREGLTAEHIAALQACGISDVGKALVTTNGTGRNDPAVQTLADEARAVLKGYAREFLIRGSTTTTGWRPSCAHYDDFYRRDFPRPSARKRWQNQTWWQRARARPGLPDWPTVPAVVLDPFLGSGTTGLVARRLGRRCVGIDLSAEYVDMSRSRTQQLSLFAS